MTTTSAASDRPWLALYPDGVEPDPRVPYASIVAAWDDLVDRRPTESLVQFFDATLAVGEVSAAVDALAAGFQDRGVVLGDRIGIYLQNVPQYVIALVAAWKVGAVVVPLNPMYRRNELRRLVDDSRPVGIVVAHGAAQETLQTVEGSSVRWLLGTHDRDLQSRDDDRAFWGAEVERPVVDDMVAVVREQAGRRPEPVELGPETTALITFTSGTTGPPKGAMSTHANVLHSARNFGAWVGLGPQDGVLAIAPLFHITGMVLNAMAAVLNDARLVMIGRFEPEVALDAILEHQVTFTIGSITAFNAIMASERGTKEHLASVRSLYSGGAPIPPSTVEAFERRFGHYIHNIWGMTETTAGGIAVPRGSRAPVDAASGSLSIGVPTQGAAVRILGPDGRVLPSGSPGELEFSAPQVVEGYWEKPKETAAALPGRRLRTGDVAVVDDEGWVYLVDRLKDQINTSGYKVWPREVEDALYAHDAVFEVAVVGRPDEYRGEAVVAHVALRPGREASAEDLMAFAKERLAAYKVPREVYVVAELPKTATGKIRRQAFREATH